MTLKTNKIIVAVSLAVFAVLIAYIIINREWIVENLQIQSQGMKAQEEALITQTVTSFYEDYLDAINKNTTWLEVINKYTTGRAKNQVSGYALLFLDDASRSFQHLAKLLTPIQTKILSWANKKAQVLVDFSISEAIVGVQPKTVLFKQLITVEKKDGAWFISELADRTEKFDEYLKAQNILK